MKKVFMINGHQKYPYAEGRLNKTLYDFIFNFLNKKGYEIIKTDVNNPYDAREETNKFVQSDIIILQSPIFGFNIGGKLKTYMDDVYEYGVFFVDNDNKDYGDYGLLTGKKYMYSLTWNAPKYAFSNPANRLFDGRSEEDVIFNLHAMMQFAGMEPIKTFNAFDVIHHPNIPMYLDELEKHLTKYF